MKITTNTGLVTFFLLTVFSCTKENISSHSSEVTQATKKTVSFAIGQRYGGGIIFYIDGTGEHGLIADTVDLPPAPWWNGAYTEIGTTGIRVGSGYGNTRRIVLSQGDSGLQYAARECWNSTRSGYKDWFLPSKLELDELHKQRLVVRRFQHKGAYWSSSEYNHAPVQYAWYELWDHGIIHGYDKAFSRSVRAIRAF